MATKFSEFDAATALTGTEEVVGLQGGDNARFPHPLNELASTASGKGAALVGTKQPTSNAISRTQDDKNKETVSLFDYMTTSEKLNVLTRLGTLDVTTAILNAIADNPGRRILAPHGRYLHSAEIHLDVDGTILEGESNGAYEFDLDNSATMDIYGTAFEWCGSAGGVQMSLHSNSVTERTTSGGGIRNLRLVGKGWNAISTNAVETNLFVPDASNSVFEHLKLSGASLRALDLTGFVPDHNWLNSAYGCAFRDIKIVVDGTADGLYAGPTANPGGGDHPAFCVFENMHITYKDGIGINLYEMDDCKFDTLGISRVVGGTGDAIILQGAQVDGNIFTNINIGHADGAAPAFRAKSGSRGNFALYAGIDRAIRPTVDSGAEFFFIYTGGNTAPADAQAALPVISLPNIVKGENNYLDWYEEGFFTPGLAFGGATTGITYSANRNGRYVRIGKTVFITQLNMELTSKGSATGVATLTGLPFTSSSASRPYAAIRPVGGFVGTSVDRGIGLIGDASATTMTFLKNVSGSGGMVGMTDTDFGNTSYINATTQFEA